MTGTPPVRRRLLGAALRRYREGLGFNLDQAALILECDRSKISRVETGQRGIRARELRELLDEYDVPSGEREALLAIAHSGRADDWWLAYRDVLSAAAQDYVSMESAATEILAYEPNQVPDLLQTMGYAAAVAEADPGCTDDEQREHAVEVKMTRQHLVLGARDPLLEFIITEGALRQQVGGEQVMRAQLAKLATIAEASVGTAPAPRQAGTGKVVGRGKNVPGNISLQVLPFASGAYAAAGCGPMAMLRFAAAPDIGVIHLSGLAGGISLEGQETLQRYLRAFGELRSAALTPAASARMLRALAGEVAGDLARRGRWHLDAVDIYRPRRGHDPCGQREPPVDIIEPGDEVLDIAELLAVATHPDAFVAITCDRHAVAGKHEQALQGERGTRGCRAPLGPNEVILPRFDELVAWLRRKFLRILNLAKLAASASR